MPGPHSSAWEDHTSPTRPLATTRGLIQMGHGDPVQFATAKQLDRPDRNGCTSYGFANWGPTHAGKAIEQSPATKGRAGGARFQFTPTARPTRPSQASSVGLAIIPTILSTPLSPHHHLTVPTPCPVPWTSVHGGCARPPLIHITFAVADCQSREREDRKRSPKAKLWSIHLSVRQIPGLGSSHWARKR